MLPTGFAPWKSQPGSAAQRAPRNVFLRFKSGRRHFPANGLSCENTPDRICARDLDFGIAAFSTLDIVFGALSELFTKMTTSRYDGGIGTTQYEWCHHAVQDVSRTFALTVEALDEPMATHICVGYLLCRIADTIEDATHIPPAEQARLLATYEAVLDPDAPTTVEEFTDEIDGWIPPAERRNADWEVVANSPIVVAAFFDLPDAVRDGIREPVAQMIDGMGLFVERYASHGGIRIQSHPELVEYCDYAAGTVGDLVTNLLTRERVTEAQRQTMNDTRASFARLLQLVNVSKDVFVDYTTENNVYLPAEWLSAEGVPQDDLVDPAYRPGTARVVSRTAAAARSCLDDAQRYLEAMPLRHGNTLAAWLAPYLLAVGTLRELDDRPEDALTRTGVKVSRPEVFAILDASTAANGEAISGLRETVERTPFHRA